MSETQLEAITSGNLVDTAADLGRRAAQAQHIDLDTGDDTVDATLLARAVRHDETLQVLDLERHLSAPRTARGTATLHAPTSFAAYISRLHLDGGPTTIWADNDTRSMTAVFDDHHSIARPGWRAHTAHLAVRVDPDWDAWTGQDGKLSTQTAFGEFLEDHLDAIIDPPAAVLMEIATTLIAKRDVVFESSTRLQSGDVEFTYRETTAAAAGKKGQLPVPPAFRIRVAPFLGADPVEISARLRYRISADGLAIGYRLLRPDLIEQAAFAFLVDLVRAGIPPQVPILHGTPPPPITPAPRLRTP